MGTTVKYLLPYPEPTDPVAQGAAAIRALAESVDPKLLAVQCQAATSPYAAVPPAGSTFLIRSGAFTGTTDPAGALGIGFNPPFPNGLVTFLGMPVAAAHYITGGGRAAMTKASVVVYVLGAGGTPLANTTLDLTYIAIGW